MKGDVDLMTSNHHHHNNNNNNNNNKNHYNNCSGDKQSNSQMLIPLAAIPHKEAYHD